MSDIKIGLIGGSGLGAALLAQTEGIRHEVETPFGPPSDAIIETEWAGLPVLVLNRHGAGHLLNPSQVPYRANIFALKQLGCTHIIASGAVGSLRGEYRPRDLVIADQIIDKTTKRPHTFYERAAVHVEFAEPFCPVMRRILLEAGAATPSPLGEGGGEGNAEHGSGGKSPHPNPLPRERESEAGVSEKGKGVRVHDGGCYVCMEGPAFSTRAESLMHRLWGGDLIGMTAMPEAKLAREAEISYALVALVTDYDCWREKAKEAATDPFILLREIIGNLEAATENAIGLIKRAVELMASRKDELAECPAQHALKLGIWSDKARLSQEEVERLKPLWGKCWE